MPPKSCFPWREPAKRAPYPSYQSVERKPREPSVPSEPIPPGLLTKEFLDNCNVMQLQLLEPLVRKLSSIPEVEEETEQERQQALLDTYFPHFFTAPTPRLAPRTQPSASRALKFSTPLPSARIVGLTDGNAEASVQPTPITDVLRE